MATSQIRCSSRTADRGDALSLKLDKLPARRRVSFLQAVKTPLQFAACCTLRQNRPAIEGCVQLGDRPNSRWPMQPP